MKRILSAALVLTFYSTFAFAGNGRLAKDGNGTSMQVFSPTTQGSVASLGTGKTSVFENVTASGLTAIKFVAATAAGVLTTIKIRLGGFTTGAETDTFVSSGETIWLNGQTTVGFHAYSTATNINLHTWKQ